MDTDGDNGAFRLAADDIEPDSTRAACQRDTRARAGVRVLAEHLRVDARST